MYGLLFQKCQGGLAALGFEADEPQRLTDCRAKFTDSLLIIHDQQTNAEIFFTSCVIHSTFPNVFEITSMNCWTRNGFSTQGAPVSRKVATVSSFAMSPVMKTSRFARSGRCRTIHACTWPPSTPPGVRISDTTPRKLPFSSKRSASTPDSQHTTGYPLRSSAACTYAITAGSSSTSNTGSD